MASVEAGYLGDTFARPFPGPIPWRDQDVEDHVDMWATLDETRDQIVDLYRRVRAHSDETIATLALDAPGQVPWWPEERRDVARCTILVHMIAEQTVMPVMQISCASSPTALPDCVRIIPTCPTGTSPGGLPTGPGSMRSQEQPASSE